MSPIEEKKYLKFIKTYCRPENARFNRRRQITNPETIESYWNKLLEDYADVNQDAIKRYLCRKKYRTYYLTTYWWYIISHKRKLMDGFKCTGEDCQGDCHVLNVHHPNYDHKGEEIKFMDSIVTLCETCHDKEHPDKQKRKPKFGKKNMVVVLTKTEEPEKKDDPQKLKKFYEDNSEWLFDDVEIVSDPKKFTVIVKTQTLNTKELRKAIINDLNILLDVLNGH